MYAGKRPYSYPNTKWLANNFDMYFEVNNSGDIKAELVVNGETIPVYLIFGQGTRLQVFANTMQDYLDSDDRIFEGECEFSSKKLIVSDIKVFKTDLVDPSITEIAFIREDLE